MKTTTHFCEENNVRLTSDLSKFGFGAQRVQVSASRGVSSRLSAFVGNCWTQGTQADLCCGPESQLSRRKTSRVHFWHGSGRGREEAGTAFKSLARALRACLLQSSTGTAATTAAAGGRNLSRNLPACMCVSRDEGRAERERTRENTQKINTPSKREPSGFYYIFSSTSRLFYFLRQSFHSSVASTCSPSWSSAARRTLSRGFTTLLRLCYDEVYPARSSARSTSSRTDRPTLSSGSSRVVLCLECPVLDLQSPLDPPH